MGRILIIMTVIFWCLPAASQDFDAAVEEAGEAADQAAAATATRDPADFQVRSEVRNDTTFFYRRDRLIMTRSSEHRYDLWSGPDTVFAHVYVWVDKPSPRIWLLSNRKVSVVLDVLPDGSLQLEAYDLKSRFLEIFILADEGVQPVPAKQYLESLADAEAAQAFFESIGQSLLNDASERDSDAEPESDAEPASDGSSREPND